MNRPCRIHFYSDSAPLYSRLPARYQQNAEVFDDDQNVVSSITVQNAFPIDFAPSIIRTRIGDATTGDIKREDPIDFPFSAITFIEWFYGQEVPDGLAPWTPKAHNGARN